MKKPVSQIAHGAQCTGGSVEISRGVGTHAEPTGKREERTSAPGERIGTPLPAGL